MKSIKLLLLISFFFLSNTFVFSSIPDLYITHSTQNSFTAGTNIGFNNQNNQNTQTNKNNQNQKTKINSSNLNFGTNTAYSSSKTQATIGLGTITVKDKENSDDITNINRDINTQTNKLYEGSTGTSVDASIDHRLFTEEGRNSIREDFYKTGKMADAISDIIEKDNLVALDFFDHVINLETNYEVSKEFALLEEGKYAKMLNDIDSLTDTQFQETITAYASVYANQHGITVEEALVTVLKDVVKKEDTTHEKPKGAHIQNDDGSSTITIDANNNKNTLDYANTIIHEGTHASVYQQESTYSSLGMHTENYANLLGGYAQNDFSFVYSNLGYGYVNTKDITRDFSNSQSFQQNTNYLMDKVINEPEKVEFMSPKGFNSPDELERLRNLDPAKPIENQINVLIQAGMTYEEIQQTLANNYQFKVLTKDGIEEFDKIYEEEKNRVDKTIAIEERTETALEVISFGAGFVTGGGALRSTGKEIVEEIIESVVKKSVDDVIETTAHGATRIAGSTATRGGVLSSQEALVTQSAGKVLRQADGAKVYLHEVSPGKFNAVVQGENGIITTMKGWSQKSIDRIAKNYGWKPE